MRNEPKTLEDFENRARGLLRLIAQKAHIDVADRRIELLFNEKTLKIVASDLLEIYNSGWDNRSISL